MVTVRNIVILAIMQVGVIVAGVLASGLCHRVFTTNGWDLPILVAMLYNYGVVALLIPLTWVTGAVALQLRAAVSDRIKILMFWTGLLILIGLAVFIIWMDVPLLIRALITFTSNPGDGGMGE
jgi:hypothetical protein